MARLEIHAPDPALNATLHGLVFVDGTATIEADLSLLPVLEHLAGQQFAIVPVDVDASADAERDLRDTAPTARARKTPRVPDAPAAPTENPGE